MSTTALFIETFRRIVEHCGNAPAVLEAGRPPMSYAELSRRASIIAAQLADLDIGRETVVGLCARKSGDYIASLLGVWWAGAAFLPLDPDIPQDRLSFMMKEAGARIVLAPVELQGAFRSLGAVVVAPRITGDAAARERPPVAMADDLAYVIFTSGSTGRPKGVMVTHRGIVNLLTAQIEAFKLSPRSRSLFLLSTAFDASISDIGTVLLSGAALCIETPPALGTSRALTETMERLRVTHIDIPPAILRMIEPDQVPLTLETIIIGGEVCPPAVVRKWAARFRVVNVYGPTEATVCTSLGVCNADTWDDPLIGLPIANIQYRILELDGQEASQESAKARPHPVLGRAHL